MHCLNCDAEMVNYDVTTENAQLSYDLCEKCGSLWLDAGELDKMAFQVAGSIEFCSDKEDKTTAKTVKKCPRCDELPLSRVKFLGETDIVLDHCKNCGGFWLDGGELNLIDSELAKIMPVSGHGFSDFVNNVHVPFWYKRIKHRSGETDFHVVVAPVPGAKREGETDHTCPACGTALDLWSIGRMEVEGCPKCYGMWLDRQELRKLKNGFNDGQLHWLNREIDSLEKTSVISSSRACPKCKTSKLLSVIFGQSSVLIDRCPSCHGLWVDRGEFDSIVQYLRDEAVRATPNEIGQELVRDLKKVASPGGPESTITELGDAAATIEAYANALIFEHPTLFNLWARATGAGRSVGMD